MTKLEQKVIVRCKKCRRRILDKVTHTTGMLEQMQTINKSELKEYIGTIDDKALMREINTAMKKTLGLWVYKPVKEENIRCLCRKCLSDYIENPDFIIRRLDLLAKVKDKCDICDKPSLGL